MGSKELKYYVLAVILDGDKYYIKYISYSVKENSSGMSVKYTTDFSKAKVWNSIGTINKNYDRYKRHMPDRLINIEDVTTKKMRVEKLKRIGIDYEQ